MSRIPFLTISTAICICACVCLLPATAAAQTRTTPLVIDHRCTNLAAIPMQWIHAAQTGFRAHYAHTSHGEQITTGLQRIQESNSAYGVAIAFSSLPDGSGVLRMFDGQEGETYITPELYWDSDAGRQMTRDVFAHNPGINLSMWMWCTQQDGNDSSDTQRYLDAMSAFEAAYPALTFVYCTGNGQTESAERLARNAQVRRYCVARNKVLFDFEDLDCWYNGQQNAPNGIPTQHPHYDGDEAGHTTYESCENKARAFWWMLARLAGWDGSPPVAETVKEIAALHRSGQTFLTWRERNDVQGERYRIYRHTQSITASNIGQATLVATVPEGSGQYRTERWKAEINAQPVQRNFIIRDLGPELADDQGLFVYTVQPGEAGNAFYAVTPVVAGNEDRSITSGANATAASVSESVQSPRPVEVWRSQSGLGRVYTQFMDFKNWNPTNDGYAYNYSVSLPDQYQAQATYPMYVQIQGYGTRYSYDDSLGTPWGWQAIQIWCDDPHQSWYYGYAKTHNYGDDWPQNIHGPLTVPTSGLVSNFTEQRILRAIVDVAREFHVDTNRVYVFGQSMGGSGALALAMRYPNVFAAAFCGEPMTNYAGDNRLFDADWIADVEMKLGSTSGSLRIVNEGPLAAHLVKYNSTDAWHWQNHQANMRERQGDEMAYIHTIHGTHDTVIEWDTQGSPWYPLMAGDARRGWTGFAQPIDHTWIGFMDTHNFGWDRFSFRKDRSFPAFSRFSLNHVSPDSTSYYNLGIEWSCPWNDFAGDIIDEDERYAIVLRLYDPGADDFQTIADSGHVDVTPRRLQHFLVTPGKRYSWSCSDVGTGMVIASGSVVPDAFGLLTIPAVPVSKDERRLLISSATTPVEQTQASLDAITLDQAPNPFASTTTVHYALPFAAPVDLSVFDAYGRRVRTLVSRAENPGMYSVRWNGTDDAGAMLPHGIYYIRLAAGSDRLVRRAALLR
jgi:pimeloyl-ACP methyl ester carboxylesterase